MTTLFAHARPGWGTGQLNMELPKAFDAPRRVLESPRAGRVSYYADLSSDGRPLVLVHSINAAPSAFEMRPLFEHFRTQRPVYAPELPGFGYSDRGDRVYSPSLFADAISDFLQGVVGRPADLVAFSLSAEFAARAAPDLGASLSSLVLLSPTGFGTRRLPEPATCARAHRVLSMPMLGPGLFALLTTRPSIRYFLGQSFVGPVPREMVEYAWATSHQPGAHHAPLYFLSGQLFTPRPWENLYSALQVPVLVIHDRDANVSFERLPEFLAAHPTWHAERIAPTLGLPHWERTDDTIAAMQRFWAAHPSP